MTAAEWIDEAQSVLDLVGDLSDTGSAEDQEFRRSAPRFMREALEALEAVLKRHAPHTETDCVDHWSECFIGGDSKCHNVGCCRNCRDTFPCLTVQAINVALGVES